MRVFFTTTAVQYGDAAACRVGIPNGYREKTKKQKGAKAVRQSRLVYV
jgi:hypothetical protein